MARINLLPWREELRRERKTQFLVALSIALGLTGLIMAGVHVVEKNAISFQKARNAFLTQQIEVLDREIEQIKKLEAQKKRLLAHMDIIQTLQASRPEIVHLFDELARTLPEGVFLTRIKQSGSNITLSGEAQSNARVSSHMWNLEKSPWLSNPNLTVIETKSKDQARSSKFELKVSQKTKDTAKEDSEKKK